MQRRHLNKNSDDAEPNNLASSSEVAAGESTELGRQGQDAGTSGSSSDRSSQEQVGGGGSSRQAGTSGDRKGKSVAVGTQTVMTGAVAPVKRRRGGGGGVC